MSKSNLIRAEDRFPAKPRPASRTIKLTVKAIMAIPKPAPGTGHTYVWDTEVKGLGAYVTAGDSRTYVFKQRVKGDKLPTQVKLEPIDAPGYTVEHARDEARKLGDLARAGKPITRQAQREAAVAEAHAGEAFTLRVAYKKYIAERRTKHGKPLRLKTREGYEQCFNRMRPWHDRGLWSITKVEVAQLMRHILDNHGDVAGVQTLGMFKAIWKYHTAQLPEAEMRICPAVCLGPMNLWPKIPRKKRQVKKEHAPNWWRAIESMADGTHKDRYGRDWWDGSLVRFFKTLLLTGCRLSELRMAEWAQYDEKHGTLFFAGEVDAVDDYEGTKPHRDHTVYIGAELKKILAEQRASQKGKVCRYIFGTYGDIPMSYRAPDNALAQFRKIYPKTKMPRWSCHDLRGTFLSVVHSKELEVPLKIQKMLVNHESESDVTLGYIEVEPEDVRGCAELVQKALLKRSGAEAP